MRSVSRTLVKKKMSEQNKGTVQNTMEGLFKPERYLGNRRLLDLRNTYIQKAFLYRALKKLLDDTNSSKVDKQIGET